MKRMFTDFKEFINALPPEGMTGLVGAAVGLLRILYDESETRPLRVVLEVAFSGCMGVVFGWGAISLGFNVQFALFVSGITGYIGHQELRKLVIRFLNNKTK